jgi:hypothetical protein
LIARNVEQQAEVDGFLVAVPLHPRLAPPRRHPRGYEAMRDLGSGAAQDVGRLTAERRVAAASETAEMKETVA